MHHFSRGWCGGCFKHLACAPDRLFCCCCHVAGEGCTLHPAYVSYVLNHTNSDAMATYVGNSLACASVVEKGELNN